MLLYIKQIINKELLYSIGNSTQYFVIAYKEKESEINKYTHTHTHVLTESLSCVPETNTVL